MGDDILLYGITGIGIFLLGLCFYKCREQREEVSEPVQFQYRPLASAPPWPSYSTLEVISEEDENPI